MCGATNKRAGDAETAPANELEPFEGLTIETGDLALVGQMWYDREGSVQYTLTTAEWSLIDSHDGKGIPVLSGSYRGVVGAGKGGGKKYWSIFNEIREWIKESMVPGALSDRELRNMRRAAASLKVAAGAANA